MATISPFALVSLANAKLGLKGLANTTAEDNRLINIINSVTAQFEGVTKRKLYTRTYKPSGAVLASGEENLLLHGDHQLNASTLKFPQWPVTSVTAVTLKESDLLTANQTVLTSADWTVDEELGLLHMIDGDEIPYGRNNVEVTWIAGYGSSHLEYAILQEACIEQVRECWYRSKRAQDGVQQISDVGGSVTYFMGALLPSVRLALDQFVRKELV